MANPLALVLIAVTLLSGGALLWALRADRLRQDLRQRLKYAATVENFGEEPATLAMTLAQAPAQRESRRWVRLPAELWGRLDRAFVAAGNRINLPLLILVAIIAATAAIGIADRIFGLNPALTAFLATAAAAAAATSFLRFAQRRYRTQFLDIFPDALDLIKRAVKAGLPVSEALAVAAREIADPVGAELRRTLSEVEIGIDMTDALRRTADRIRVSDFRFCVVALSLQRKTGGNLAETLGNLSSVIRARKALRLKAAGLSAEAKASAFVLSLLPLCVGGLLSVINPDFMSVLLHDPRGRFMVGIALLDLGIGIVTMSQIIKWSLR